MMSRDVVIVKSRVIIYRITKSFAMHFWKMRSATSKAT